MVTLDPKIEFRDPPAVLPRLGNATDWERIVAALKKNKGQFGLVGVYSPGIASHIRSGRYKQFHPHGDDAEKAKAYMRRHWEVTVRKTDDDTGHELYIRWLG
jgi:hypothetical protein